MALPVGAALFQIYTRSFRDSNGDGVGDLPGATGELGYLRRLGVDHVWFSPLYPSTADFGYAVSNYVDIDPLFGTLADFDRLVAEAKKHGIGIVMDAVFNHTSDQHPWFVESREDKTNSKRRWYIWADPAPDGGPPNNWISVFGGSAWTFDPRTGQYYLHSFLDEQPDLNWENPEVQAAAQEVLRFWFRRGVMGVRLDAVDWMGKDLVNFADDPANPDYNPKTDHDPYHRLTHQNSTRGPQLHTYLRAFEVVAQEFPGRFIVTESYPREGSDVTGGFREILDRHTPGISAPFNFGLMRTEFTAPAIKELVANLMAALHGHETLVNVLGNHDNGRLASKAGERLARLMAMLQLSLPGIPVIFQGDERGVTDGFVHPDEVRDPAALQAPELGRDRSRTCQMWTTNGPNFGFTTGTSWLPITQPVRMSVEAQENEPGSMLMLYRALLALRRGHVLRAGEYLELGVSHPDVFGYIRVHGGQMVAVLLNFSAETVIFNTSLHTGKLLLSTEMDVGGTVGLDEVTLRPGEGWIVRVA